jgi:peptidoglycan lytic transglycosylase D
MTKYGLTFTIRIIFIILCCAILHSNTFASPPNIEGIEVYQKNLHLSLERKQSLADDIDRYHNADNMWNVIRSEFTLPHYEEYPLVKEQIEWFMNHQDFLYRSAARAAPYLYYISQQARKRHLPAEIVLLPMIESAYNPFAYSTAGAAGIWQMMPGTASGFGIKQNWWYDGRRDIVASTKAALDYLVYLGGFFDGNWLLALAAYDTGEGNVLAAIRKNTRDGISTDFWLLPVAQETRDYVPRLLALATIIANPDQYPVEFPVVNNAPYLAQIDMGNQIDLKEVAYLAGLSFKEIKQLNPGYTHTTTDPNGPFKIVLPIENVEQFTENLVQFPQYAHSVKHYKIRSGDTMLALAKKFKTTVSSLREMNQLKNNHIKPGKKLIVPQIAKDELQQSTVLKIAKGELQQSTVLKTTKDELQQSTVSKTAPDELEQSTVPQYASIRSNDNAMPFDVSHIKRYQLQPGDTLYMVRQKDDIYKIAARFHVSPQVLYAINQIQNKRVLPVGTKLIIPTHYAKSGTTQHYQLAPGDTIYMVREGDTLEHIANKFHTSQPALRIANLMASNHVKEGDRLIIPKDG